ncbi:MAG: serine/threonine protein kinase [Cocleimonas sp.]|nr:serine/threonine protein kinase [Cocleimonas sp.]
MVVQGNKSVVEEKTSEAKAYARIEKYFLSALAVDKKNRIEWLNHALSDDLDILKEVKLLLCAHHETDSFLETPAPVKATIDDMTSRCPDLAGRRLGVYEVITKIATGGMGRIYSAKRVDGEYEKMVAIKVVEYSSLDTGLFQKERQLLADFQHPNIVTLLDGGTLKEGFPYLVMELVDGLAINRYVNSAELSIKEIVTLCCELCAVVDDAHQQGIIHCDLKPDNILVINKGSRKGTLKLLDFGIAQTLSLRKTEADIKPRGLTPEYASPQCHYNKVPHATDDVFSLGVILGQLLSGQPLSLIQKTSQIKEHYQAPDINELATHIEDRELVQIMRKATANKRSGRYHSAKALQDDLQNWLDEKPVAAAQGGMIYALSKSIHRVRYIIFIVVTLALLAALIGQILGEHYEFQQSSDLREHNAIDAVDDLNTLLSSIPYTPKVEKEVTTLTLNLLQNLHKATPDSQIIKKRYADILIRMANVNGHPYYLNLENKAKTRRQYEKALGLYKELENLESSKLDESIQQSAIVNQRYIEHRLAGFEIYEKGESDPNTIFQAQKKMILVWEKLASREFVNLPSKQRLLLINMLLENAYESLRITPYVETWALLGNAKKMLENNDIDVANSLNEHTYLQAFYYEITGHYYYLQGNVNAALTSYSKIKRSIAGDQFSGRYRYLLTRVDSAFACLGYLQKNNTMQQQHFKYFDYARANLEALANEYTNVPFLQYRSDNMNQRQNVRTAKGQKAFCANPIEFLLPSMKI